MPTLIIKGFTLTLDNGDRVRFEPGHHDFSKLPGAPKEGELTTKDYSDHFFVRAHSDNPSEGPIVPGSPHHITAMRALADKKRNELLEAEKALAEAEKLASDSGAARKEAFGKTLLLAGDRPQGSASDIADDPSTPDDDEVDAAAVAAEQEAARAEAEVASGGRKKIDPSVKLPNPSAKLPS
jgi:hypothetical protein